MEFRHVLVQQIDCLLPLVDQHANLIAQGPDLRVQHLLHFGACCIGKSRRCERERGGKKQVVDNELMPRVWKPFREQPLDKWFLGHSGLKGFYTDRSATMQQVYYPLKRMPPRAPSARANKQATLFQSFALSQMQRAFGDS